LSIPEDTGLTPKILNRDALGSVKDPAMASAHCRVIEEEVSLSGATDEKRGKLLPLAHWNYFLTSVQNEDEGEALGHGFPHRGKTATCWIKLLIGLVLQIAIT